MPTLCLQAEDCCMLCAQTVGNGCYSGCAAYTWFSKGQTGQATCYLHGADRALGNSTHSIGHISGIVRATNPNAIPLPPQPIIKTPGHAHNVLLIVSDDMRPEMFRAYDRAEMITPNLDALAQQATTFHRAYCQQAICGPSRNSFMSGRRPQRTQAWNFLDHFREPRGGKCGNESARTEDGRTWISFPGWFKY